MHASRQLWLHQVIAHESISRSANRIKQLERDLLPGGVPNSPNRRLSYAIKHALSVHKLARLYASNAHKLVWFKDKHVAAMLMRAASLLYYRQGLMLVAVRPAQTLMHLL